MQNLVVLSHTVFAHVGRPKSFGGRWDPAPWDGGLADPQNHATPRVAKFGMVTHRVLP